MKRLFMTLTALLLTFSVQVQADDFETAAQAVKNMGPGWNLGNTLDANDGSMTWTTTAQHETCWGQPVTKPELIKMFKEAGFGAIRVPITWYQEMDADGNVNEDWMKRVHEVVDYVIDQGLYCIINVHHDTGAHDQAWVIADEDNYDKTKARFENLWTQIANEFKDYGDHLLFAGYNEMLDKLNSWCFASFAASGQYNATIAESAYKGLNGYAQSFVNAVRATGGNNAQRNLIINTYASANGGGNWNAHLTDVLTKLEAPTDVTEGHIAYEVHAYPTLNTGKSELDDIIKKVNQYLAPNGPVIIGEWGTDKVDKAVTDYDSQREKYLDFAKYFIQQTKANNIATFYWMGLSDGAYRNVPAFNQADLAETITKAWHGDGFEGVYPTVGGESGGWVVAWEGEQPLMWSTWLKVDGTTFAAQGANCVVAITYTQKAVNSDGGDLQFWFADWSSKITVKVGDKEFAGDFWPDKFYGTTDQTYTTNFTFSDDTYNKICQKGFMLDGQNVVLKKIALTSATGIKTLLFNADQDESSVYSLSGQRVTNPTKGLYIRNGKKFIVR